jgi:hypothetical protein
MVIIHNSGKIINPLKPITTTYQMLLKKNLLVFGRNMVCPAGRVSVTRISKAPLLLLLKQH